MTSVNLTGLAWQAASVLTPLGDEPAQVYHAVNAGLSAYMASAFTNCADEPMTLAQIPDEALDATLPCAGLAPRQARLLRLAATALARLPASTKTAPPLLLAAPEKLPGGRTPFDDRLLARLHAAMPKRFNLAASYVLPAGRAAGLQAFKIAQTLVNEGVNEVIIGAVDSLIDDALLIAWDAAGRVLAAGVSDGFCPGEGAAFVRVSQAGVSRVSPLQLLRYGEALEPNHRYSDEPPTGAALAEACRHALSAERALPVAALSGTLNGESYYATEWGVAQIRNRARLADACAILHPADCLGDLGAAAGLVHMVLLEQAYRAGELHGPSLATAASELGLRAALLVTD